MKKIRNEAYLFFTFFFLFFIVLLILVFIVDFVNYFNILVRLLFFSAVSYGCLIFGKKFKKIFPTGLFIFLVVIFLLTYFLSSYENPKIVDIILGIDRFSKKFFIGKFNFSNFILEPLIYERYITALKSFEEKLKEFNHSTSYLELIIHENVNKIRAIYNTSILIYDQRLAEIARYHSKDMAEKNYFDHISPSGETLADRFRRFNYTCKIFVNNYVYEGAENLFLGFIYKSYTYDKLTGKIISYEFYSLEELAQEVVNSWYKSDGHRRNMLFEHWRKEGIGVFIDNEGKILITQVFC